MKARLVMLVALLTLASATHASIGINLQEYLAKSPSITVYANAYSESAWFLSTTSSTLLQARATSLLRRSGVQITPSSKEAVRSPEALGAYFRAAALTIKVFAVPTDATESVFAVFVRCSLTARAPNCQVEGKDMTEEVWHDEELHLFRSADLESTSVYPVVDRMLADIAEQWRYAHKP